MSARMVPVVFPVTVCPSCVSSSIVARVTGTSHGAYRCTACDRERVGEFCDADTLDYAPAEYAPLIDTPPERMIRAVWGIIRRVL